MIKRSLFASAALLAGATIGAAAASALSAVPQGGGAPLQVTFTGDGGNATYFGGVELDFGDGQQQHVCPPGRGCKEIKVSHTYAKPGRYVARLQGIGEGKALVIGTVTVTVSAR
jgi:PKD repeat protein